MHFTKFKTKVIFTLGIYAYVWRYQAAKALRDEHGAPLRPGVEVVSLFVPIWGLIKWWQFLVTVRETGQKAGLKKTLSVGHGFWFSWIWFGAGPYVNRHLNALADAKKK